MTARNWRDNKVPENLIVANGGVTITSNTMSAPQVTTWVANSSAQTISGPTIDLGAGLPVQRIGVLAQYVQDVATTIQNGIEMEVQWSANGTNWYVAPTSAQGDARSSTITTTGSEKTLITRGQVLARYLRWQIRTAGGGLSAGFVYLWYTRI